MIDVEELRALIRFDQMPLSDIEQIFRALIGYPGEEEIINATRADLTGALDAACEALIGDGTPLPPQTLALVVGRGTIRPAPTYGAAAAIVRGDPAAWHAKLRA